VFSSGTARWKPGQNPNFNHMVTCYPHEGSTPAFVPVNAPPTPTSHKVKPKTRNYMLKDREIRPDPSQPRPLYF
jgi:hypothetical protein